MRLVFRTIFVLIFTSLSFSSVYAEETITNALEQYGGPRNMVRQFQKLNVPCPIELKGPSDRLHEYPWLPNNRIGFMHRAEGWHSLINYGAIGNDWGVTLVTDQHDTCTIYFVDWGLVDELPE